MFFCNILYIYRIIKKRTHRMLGTAPPVLFSLPVWESRMSCGQGHRNHQDNCIFSSGRVKTDAVLRIIAGNKAFSRTVVGSVRCNALSASLHS